MNLILHIPTFPYIHKTKSNFTVFITEYFYSCFDWIKINYQSIRFHDLSEQNSGKMISASHSSIELYVLSLKTNN